MPSSPVPDRTRPPTGRRRRRATATCALVAVSVVMACTALTAPPASAAPTADTGATVSGESWVDGRTLDLTITSPSTERATSKVRILLPTGWSKTATRTWPTLYVLHGGFDDYKSWTGKTDIEQLSANRQAIIVMPDTSWCSAYTDWWNYGKGGRPKWETYVTTEIPQLLERGYRANTTRAIAGNSMGGLGAMKLAANHNTMFKAAASFSGDVDPLHQYAGGSGVSTPGLACFADWKRVWGDPAVPAQRAIWEANDPWNQAAKLRGLSLYFSSGGTSDMVEAQVDKETHGVVTKLQSLGIPATTHFYTGTHTWSYWQNELHAAYPQLMAAIGA
jgi:S-formylglutathione hydrolase FrmB